MAQSEDLEGQVAARSDERECGDEQGDEEVQHGRVAWSGGGLASTISRWTVFLGRTGSQRANGSTLEAHKVVTDSKAVPGERSQHSHRDNGCSPPRSGAMLGSPACAKVADLFQPRPHYGA